MLDKNKLYYLSHPFTTHGDRKENQEKAADIEMRLREKYGIKVINPILLPLGPDSDKAMKQCKYLHDACDETIFCDDWDKSKGCKEEFTWCNDLNRRYHLTELLLEDEAIDWLEKFKKRKIAINCKTEYEADIFMNILARKNFKWISGKELSKTLWYLDKEKTCYFCSDNETNRICRYCADENNDATDFETVPIDYILNQNDICEEKKLLNDKKQKCNIENNSINLNENKEKKLDNGVDHPFHYNKGIECIDYIESHNFNFNLGNAVKYISRCEHKGNKIKDIEKAIWYLKRELEKENK